MFGNGIKARMRGIRRSPVRGLPEAAACARPPACAPNAAMHASVRRGGVFQCGMSLLSSAARSSPKPRKPSASASACVVSPGRPWR